MKTAGSSQSGWYPDSENPDQRPVGGADFGDLSSWVIDTFARLAQRIVPVAALLYIAPAVCLGVIAVFARLMLADVRFDNVTDELTGFDRIKVALLIVAAVIGVIIGGLSSLAAYHQLYASYEGKPASLKRSVRAAWSCLPRALAWGLLLMLGIGAFAVGVSYLAYYGVTADVGPGLAVILMGIFLLIVLVFFCLAVRMLFWIPAVAVGPPGINPFKTTWSMTQRRWTTLAARMIVLSIIMTIISSIIGFFLYLGIGLILDTSLEFNSVTLELTTDGEDIFDLETVDFDSLLPGAGAFFVIAMLYWISQAVYQMLLCSGVAGLYHRGGGPSEI